MLTLYLVTLTIDNGCRKEKWKIIIPEKTEKLALWKAEEIYFKNYAGYEDIVITSDSKVQLISMTEYTIIK